MSITSYFFQVQTSWTWRVLVICLWVCRSLHREKDLHYLEVLDLPCYQLVSSSQVILKIDSRTWKWLVHPKTLTVISGTIFWQDWLTGPHIMCLGQRSGLFSDCCAWSSAYCTASRRVCLKVLVLYLLKMHMNAFCVIYGSLLTPRAIPYCHLRWRIGLPDTSHRVLFCVVQIIHLGNMLFKSFRTPHHLRSLGYVFKALPSLLVATVYCC